MQLLAQCVFSETIWMCLDAQFAYGSCFSFLDLTRFSQIGLPNESAHRTDPCGLFPTLWFVTKTVVSFPEELFEITRQFLQYSDLFLDQFTQLTDMPEVCVN
jgi:hypothetical protein